MNTGWVLPLCWILTIIYLPIQLIIDPTYISQHTWEFVGSIAFVIILAPFMWGLFFPKKERRYEPSAPETIGNFVKDVKQGKYDAQVETAARTIKNVGENVAKNQIEKLASGHPEIKKGMAKLNTVLKSFKK